MCTGFYNFKMKHNTKLKFFWERCFYYDSINRKLFLAIMCCSFLIISQNMLCIVVHSLWDYMRWKSCCANWLVLLEAVTEAEVFYVKWCVSGKFNFSQTTSLMNYSWLLTYQEGENVTGLQLHSKLGCDEALLIWWCLGAWVSVIIWMPFSNTNHWEVVLVDTSTLSKSAEVILPFA